MMDFPSGKFDDCSFSRFGAIMQTNRHTHTQTDRRRWTLYSCDPRRHE